MFLGTNIPTLYLSKLNFESLARNLLLALHYRIEIYQFQIKGGWNVAYKASPGNLMEVGDVWNCFCYSLISILNLKGILNPNLRPFSFE